MKTLRYMMLMLMALLTLTACDDDDDAGSATMAITAVYLQDTDSNVPSRPVEFARLGQLIRIEGSGFTGLKKIYINGYDTYFNNALMSDNNVFVTLNMDTPVADADETERNTIRLVKDNAELIYQFTIRAASPSISSIDNTLPMPGELVTVEGANLQEITLITLPGGVNVTEGITSDEDGEWFTFTMPSGVTEGGSITAVGANGTAISAEYFNNRNCMVMDFENSDDLGNWSATFTPDDLVDDPLNSGRGKVAQLIPDTYLEANGEVAAGVSHLNYWYTAGNDYALDDWNRMTAYIPAETPVGELALQFDIYCPEPWNLTGQLEITLQNNLSNFGWGSGNTQYSDEYVNTAYVWVPWMDEETGENIGGYQTDGWKTVTIPLTKFGKYTPDDTKATMQTVIDDRNAGSYRNFGFCFCNTDVNFSDDIVYPAAACSLKIYVDNFRIVTNVSEIVSDYPDEEEEPTEDTTVDTVE